MAESQKNPVGRPKKIESPEKLWEHFKSYREKVRANPLQRLIKGNKGFIVSDEALRVPLTLEGFENYCFEEDIIADLGHYFANTDNKYSDFCTICSTIRKIIRQDQIEGGMCGLYNASITQRLNGLVDKQEQAIQMPGVSKEELAEIANKINA